MENTKIPLCHINELIKTFLTEICHNFRTLLFENFLCNIRVRFSFREKIVFFFFIFPTAVTLSVTNLRISDSSKTSETSEELVKINGQRG